MERIYKYFIPFLAAMTTFISLSGNINASVTLDGEEIIFRIREPGAEEVYLVGDFNSWNPTMDIMVNRDGYFEIRLFLLPGRYSYAFLVDGRKIPDPDNPYRDEAGNSYFILEGKDGDYRIIYRDGERRLIRTGGGETVLNGELIINAGEDQGELLGRFDFRGKLGERLEGDISTGGVWRSGDWEDNTGRVFLLGGEVVYQLERGALRAFTRRSGISAGDPLDLFGTVGPYDYPLGLFCSGIEYSGRLFFGMEGNIFYAGRLDGYSTGPETVEQGSWCTPRCCRDLADSDIGGVVIDFKTKNIRGRLLYRQDKRKNDNLWEVEGEGNYIFSGYEKTRMGGGWFTFPRKGNFSIDVEILRGRCYLSSTGKLDMESPALSGFEESGLDLIREEGWRAYTGMNFHSDRVGLELSFETTILDNRDLGGVRPEGRHTAITGSASYQEGDLALLFCSGMESFTARNTGDIFWLQRMNFWLDGDNLSINRLPFIRARSIYSLSVDISYRLEKKGGGCRMTGGDIFCSLTGEPGSGYSGKINARGGLPLFGPLSLLTDLRYINYQVEGWGDTAHFLDAFIALQAGLKEWGWVSLGGGVNPCSHDRWRYVYTGRGREKYLFRQGVMDAVEGGDRAEILNALSGAEKRLSDEMYIEFEAGFEF